MSSQSRAQARPAALSAAPSLDETIFDAWDGEETPAQAQSAELNRWRPSSGETTPGADHPNQAVVGGPVRGRPCLSRFPVAEGFGLRDRQTLIAPLGRRPRWHPGALG